MNSIDEFNENNPLLVDPTFWGNSVYGKLEDSKEGELLKLSKIVNVGTVLITTLNSQYRYAFTSSDAADYFFKRVRELKKGWDYFMKGEKQ
tara:strand:- start:107837 stop:108109 length:273 start_codon:yes stop_codon:yes gene_type:complete